MLAGLPEAPQPTLSPRAAEVLEGMMARRSQTEIASDLSLSVHTVSHHVSDLIHAYGVRSSVELVAAAWSTRYAVLEAEAVRLRAALAQIDRRRTDRRQC